MLEESLGRVGPPFLLPAVSPILLSERQAFNNSLRFFYTILALKMSPEFTRWFAKLPLLPLYGRVDPLGCMKL